MTEADLQRWERHFDETNPANRVLSDEIRRLRGLVKAAKWGPDTASDAELCPWCEASSYNNRHEPDCEAFNKDGEVK